MGAGAVATAQNEVALGGQGSAVRIGDIDASTNAQIGPVDAVTVDTNGVLGRRAVASAQAVQSMEKTMTMMAQMTAERLDALTMRIDGLDFRLEELDQRTNGGIAAAMAMGGTMIVPDARISFSANLSTFAGEQGFSGSMAARVNDQVYISAAIAGSSAPDTTGGRVGVAFGF